MTHPPKWRETCDPFALPLRHFRLTEVLGYPHARNDVFHVRGVHQGRECTAYLKVARHPDSAIAHEAAVLCQLRDPVFPRVLDADEAQGRYSVTAALPGQRLSLIVGENKALDSLAYMEAYGEALAKLHQLTPDAPPQAERHFHRRPSAELLSELELSHLEGFFSNPPPASPTVFCHGDLHYANILWQDRRISAILDFELSGYGSRDMDVAWAIFLRPGQLFLRTEEERRRFLTGYCRHGACDPQAIRYYTAQFYVWFLRLCGRDPEYARFIRTWLSDNCPGT